VKIDGEEEWLVTSIPILLGSALPQDYYYLTVFHDSLFLTNYRSGYVVQSSLDGKIATIIAKLSGWEIQGTAANANGVFVSTVKNGVTKIELLPFFWSPEHHSSMHLQVRRLVGTLVVASRCNNNALSGKCQLKRLPREILLLILSFLDSNSLVQRHHLPAQIVSPAVNP
jgi:hypothetical protein